MQSPMVEMSNPKHIMILDELNYFYAGSPPKARHTDVYYSQISTFTLPPYNTLKSLNDTPTRNYKFQPKIEKL